MNRLFEYAANHPFLVAATALIALVAIALEARHRLRGSSAIGTGDAVLLANQGALVLDVRSDEEFASGHIIDARHIRGSDLVSSVDTLKKYREKPIVVYCESGTVSATAARVLKAQGFTKVVNLKGGLQSWRQDNLPLVKDKSKGNAAKGAKAQKNG